MRHAGYHLDVASSSADNADTHCPYASESGGGVCPTFKTRIANFCKTFQSRCSDAKYMDEATCVTAMTKKDSGDFGATGGDSFSCRE